MPQKTTFICMEPTVKITHIKNMNYRVYFSSTARKLYPHERVKFDQRTLTLRVPSEFEPATKIGKCGNASWSSFTDIEGMYLLEKEDDVFYLTLIKE